MPKRLDPLTRAAIRSGSDKYGGHLYTPIYHALFQHLREEPVKLLEIGIGGYGSERAGGLGLKMWAEYFPTGTVAGLDIQPKSLVLSPRIKIFQGSQIDTDALDHVSNEAGPFDIVIDDGSHVVDHMVGTFRHLYPRIAANGIYAVEDTQTSFTPSLGGRNDGTGTIFELAHRISLAMHCLEGFVDPAPDPLIAEIAAITASVSVYRNIVVFQRGGNSYPSNSGLDFQNPEVQEVFESIAEQDRRDPAPAGILSRIDMLIWAGKVDQAGALAVAAADRHQTDLPLLFELVRMMEWAKLVDCRIHIAAYLSKASE